MMPLGDSPPECYVNAPVRTGLTRWRNWGVSAQVEFNDSSGSLDLSAVQVHEGSIYMAEDTSFEGFTGEVCVDSVASSVCGQRCLPLMFLASFVL